MHTAVTPPAQAYRRMLNRMGWSLLIFFALFSATNTAAEVIVLILPMDNIPTRILYGIAASVAYIVPFFAAGMIFSCLSRRKKRKLFSSVAPARPVDDRIILPAAFPLLVLAGLSLNLVAAELNFYFCQLVGYSVESDPIYYDTADAVILYMTTAIAPAFAEEFLFRGVIFANLRPFGKWQAVIISALTFSLMHQNLSQLFYTFVCGIIMALMYEWTGSIWCGVFFHLFNNQIAVLSEALVYGAYGETAYYAILVWNAVIVLLGAVSAVILTVYAIRKRRLKRASISADPSIFGASADRTTAPEAWDRPLDARGIRRGLCSPGMLLFILFSVITIIGMYILVLVGNRWEGWM